MKIANKKNRLRNLILILIVSTLVIAIFKLLPETKARQKSITNINITYSSEQNEKVFQNVAVNNDTQGALLINFGEEGTASWTSSSIEDTYTDINGNNLTAMYEASFAGWKLLSINGKTLTREYIYPDNDYIYMNDEPFVSNTNITDLEFEAVWGKTIFVRDQYNFVDITNVYGYNVENSTGDILTAKINWDTSETFSNDYYSGATKDKPVSSITKAYELLKNSYGGKIYIVNHLTLEAPQTYYAYDENYTNSNRTHVYELGKDLNISGVVTISGENMGSGTTVENKENGGATFLNSYLYVKNTRGAGLYNGKTYPSLTMQIRFHTNTVLEAFSFMSYRENYNSNGARQTADTTIYNIAGHRLLVESTFLGYKRTTSQNNLGLETGNFSHSAVTGIVEGNSVSFSKLSPGLSGCTHIYGSTSAYTSENQNIYLTLRGGTSWWNLIGASLGSNTKFQNMHIYVENLTVSALYATNSGKLLSANSITVYSNNTSISIMSISQTSNVNVNETNLIIGKDGNKVISNIYGGGYNTSKNGAIYEVNTNLNIKVTRRTYNKPIWWRKSSCHIN